MLDKLLLRGWVLLALLAGLLALTGGASRYDAIQISILRPFSALFLILSLALVGKNKSRGEAALIAMLAFLIAIVVLQLVPLPPWLWQNLPGRDGIARMDSLLGIKEAWRPLTLAPMRTWNVLGSLVVPASGLLLAIALGVSAHSLLKLIAALGVFNALLGLVQVLTGGGSFLYFYEITNRGSPVGIFANENHSAIFAACSMLIVTALGIEARGRKGESWGRLLYPSAFFLILMVSLIGGSRAGLAASIGVFGISFLMLIMSESPRQTYLARGPVSRWINNHPRSFFSLPIMFIILIAAIFVTLNRSPAFNEILLKDNFADLRWSIWPVIQKMLKIHWVFGTGFGSFEQAYQIYEPSSLLLPHYINQAHNDWMQLLIEGGILSFFLLICLLSWVVRAVLILSVQPGGRVRAFFWTSVFAIIGLASLIDYPLRTPTFQLVAVWLLVALSRDLRYEKEK